MIQNSQQQNNDIENQCLVPVVVTAPIINGIIGGISSVITAYFFKPVWEKITKLWKNKDK
jgi:hypothetical protein